MKIIFRFAEVLKREIFAPGILDSTKPMSKGIILDVLRRLRLRFKRNVENEGAFDFIVVVPLSRHDGGLMSLVISLESVFVSIAPHTKANEGVHRKWAHRDSNFNLSQNRKDF
jgi:hypothetical protein